MAANNGLITTFFSSAATELGDEPATEKQDSSGYVGRNGFALDLGGLLHQATKDRQAKKMKKKRSGRKSGHQNFAKQSGDDVCLGQEERDRERVAVESREEERDSVTLKQRVSLSSSWQQVFNRSHKSPTRRTASSPKRCRSPRQPAHCNKSPLKQSVKRQILTTPTAARGSTLALESFDHAPFTGLVHVQQADEYLSTCRELSITLPLKLLSPMVPAGTDTSLSLSLSAHHSPVLHLPLFEPVTDCSFCLRQLQRDHPSVNVNDIYSRYCSLTRKSHHCSDGRLLCSINVKVVKGEKKKKREIIVDRSIYPKPHQLQDHMHSDLWSSIYRPRKCSEVIGNSDQCSQLCAWLRRWSNGRTPTPEVEKKETRAVLRPRSQTKNSDEWWFTELDEDFVLPARGRRGKKQSGLAQKYLEEDSDAEEDDDDDIKPVMVVCGPVGCGKTAAIYACAQEMGFGVYEVNSSSSRGRGQILSTLREVTLSHLVAQRKRNGLTMVDKNSLPQTVSLEDKTLILLEEVDVLFGEEERGFWSAIYEIIRTTKRPFVMTCSDANIRLSCPYSHLSFTRPLPAHLVLHLHLLSLAHGVSLSSESANQIVSYFNSDIRKIFHYMHAWLSWSPSNQTQAPPQSSNLPYPYRLSANWRYSYNAVPPTSSFNQSDLFATTAFADHLSTLDLLTPPEDVGHPPWWRVAPVNHVLDELSVAWPSDVTLTRTRQDIAMEIARITGPLPHLPQCSLDLSSALSVHRSLKPCTDAFPLTWRLSRVAMATEGLPFLRLLVFLEDQRKALCTKRRFVHYFSHFDIPPQTLSSLAKANFFCSK